MKAIELMKHYPTLSSLIDAFEKCSTEGERAYLLENCFGKRKETKLSREIYEFMSSRDCMSLM